MDPEEIPFGVYTHINFAFATIDPVTFEIKGASSNTEHLMERITTIKLLQPDIQIWIAVGGWTFSNPGPTAKTFSELVSSTSNQDKFISSLLKMMNNFGFDGIDIDWSVASFVSK